MTTAYQVMRPFEGRAIGDVLPAESFASTRRAQQLVEQRYIQTAVLAVEGYQPTAATLLTTAIRPLRESIKDVQDVDVLKIAKAQETREVAVQMIERRIGELEAMNA